jgi:AraC-like DNA-binding protein
MKKQQIVGNKKLEIENHPKAYFYRQIVLSKIFIDTNYSKKIDIDNIAGTAFFSKFHFIRQFKKIYGKTPHQYLISIRIEKAMELLRSDKNITDVCYSVGFESLSSFSGLFKRIVGKSPSEYLIQQQKIKSSISKTPLKFIPGCFSEKKDWMEMSNFGEAI